MKPQTDYSRSELVKKYFIRNPKKPNYTNAQLLIVLGIVIIGIGIATVPGLALLGVIPLLVGGANYNQLKSEYSTLITEAEPKPLDKQIDEWLVGDVKTVMKEAQLQLGISDEDISTIPLVIDAPHKGTKWAKGTDGIWRFQVHNMLVFFLTKHHASIFKGVIDLATGTVSFNLTKEFPYKGITNLETTTDNQDMLFADGAKVFSSGAKTLSIYTSGGDKIAIEYYFISETSENNDSKLPDPGAETALKALRKRLKEYSDKFSPSDTLH